MAYNYDYYMWVIITKLQYFTCGIRKFRNTFKLITFYLYHNLQLITLIKSHGPLIRCICTFFIIHLHEPNGEKGTVMTVKGDSNDRDSNDSLYLFLVGNTRI